MYEASQIDHAIRVDATARLKVFCDGVDGRYIKSLSFGAGFHVHHISDTVVNKIVGHDIEVFRRFQYYLHLRCPRWPLPLVVIKLIINEKMPSAGAVLRSATSFTTTFAALCVFRR